MSTETSTPSAGNPRPITALAASAGNSHHIPALDGLRGIAILMVIPWHYLAFTRSFFPGWAGVDLFFVLSGYLITGKLVAAKGQPHYFTGFYRNRILRIFPLYYTLVGCFFLAVNLWVSEKNLPFFDIYLQHWKSFLIFTQNWTFILFGFPRDISLTPLWSLAVEEQFYLVWPLIIFLTPNSRLRIKAFSVLLLLILIARSAFYLHNPPSGNAIYYNTIFRMDGFLAGSLLFLLQDARILIPTRLVKGIILTLLIICIAGCTIPKNVNPHTPFFATAGYTVLDLLFAGLLYLAVQPCNTTITVFLRAKFLRFCGKISYCLYLIHVPILVFITTRLSIFGAKHWPAHAAIVHWLAIILSLLLSFLLSIASYRYFESRFLRLKTRRQPLPNRAT